MLSVRTALFLSAFLGVLCAFCGIFTTLNDFGVGMAVAAASIAGWGLCDWIEEQ